MKLNHRLVDEITHLTIIKFDYKILSHSLKISKLH